MPAMIWGFVPILLHLVMLCSADIPGRAARLWRKMEDQEMSGREGEEVYWGTGSSGGRLQLDYERQIIMKEKKPQQFKSAA